MTTENLDERGNQGFLIPDQYLGEIMRRNAKGLTDGQALILSRVEPGVWFEPDSYKLLDGIQNRMNSCRHLAERGFLLKRPFSDLGYVSFQYCLTVKKAEELGIKNKDAENA